ncbi:hypothetical protein TNCV_175881 [Trichonephila clavipes]|nr:hypothetical protein TNCV_175881 [Trichonephila clavipes]
MSGSAFSKLKLKLKSPLKIRGSECRGSPVVKVTHLRLKCPQFKPCIARDPPFRGNRFMLNMSKLKRPPVSEVWKLGEWSDSSGVTLVT